MREPGRRTKSVRAPGQRINQMVHRACSYDVQDDSFDALDGKMDADAPGWRVLTPMTVQDVFHQAWGGVCPCA